MELVESLLSSCISSAVLSSMFTITSRTQDEFGDRYRFSFVSREINFLAKPSRFGPVCQLASHMYVDCVLRSKGGFKGGCFWMEVVYEGGATRMVEDSME